MTRTVQPTARSTRRPSGTATSGFRIKWDRTILALVAVLALVTFLATGVAAAFGAGTGVAAAVSILVAVAAVAALRFLAVRNRKARTDRRIEQAFDEAMNPALPDSAESAGGTVRQSRVFDAAAGRPDAEARHGAATTAAADPAAFAGTSSRPSGTPAHRATQDQATAGTGTGAAQASQDSTAVPSVPRPTYLDAAEAERPVPDPLAKPQEPKASPGTTLKSGVSAEYRAQVDATANRALDLDKVLERRRAV